MGFDSLGRMVCTILFEFKGSCMKESKENKDEIDDMPLFTPLGLVIFGLLLFFLISMIYWHFRIIIDDGFIYYIKKLFFLFSTTSFLSLGLLLPINVNRYFYYRKHENELKPIFIFINKKWLVVLVLLIGLNINYISYFSVVQIKMVFIAMIIGLVSSSMNVFLNRRV